MRTSTIAGVSDEEAEYDNGDSSRFGQAGVHGDSVRSGQTGDLRSSLQRIPSGTEVSSFAVDMTSIWSPEHSFKGLCNFFIFTKLFEILRQNSNSVQILTVRNASHLVIAQSP